MTGGSTRARAWARARWVLGFVALLMLVGGPAMAGPPGMPDPRMMSGIPRPDPQVPGGTITVRALHGSFDEPAIGVAVTLELTAADGTTKATRTATTVDEGRATFSGLEDFAGGVGVAKVSLDGEALKSQPILVNPQTGTRVMLVKGASAVAGGPGGPGPGAPPSGHGVGEDAGAHGMPALREGVPFPLPPAENGQTRPAGSLVVGIIEPAAGAPDPRADVPVTLEIRKPGDAADVAPELKKATTDVEGRAAFTDLGPPHYPEGTRFTVVAQIEPGEAPRRSETFEMDQGAMALIFTPSRRLDATAAPPPPGTPGSGTPPGAQPPANRRPPLPPPQPAPNLGPGVVEVALVDADDQPVRDHTVTLVKRDLTGRNVEYKEKTSGLGVARFTEVKASSDAFFMVAATYDGAPYQSGFFEMTDTMGVRAALRVFPTTDDPRTIRSALQYELRPLENDFVQVIQVYEVFVEGDAAFWPAGGMRIYGAEGSRNLKVLPSAQRWLEEKDSAPFATLAEPIEPGRIVELSIAYVLEHDGTVTVNWDAPFPLVQGMAVLGDELSLEEGAAGPGERPPHDPEKGEVPPEVMFYPLKVGEFAKGPCELAEGAETGEDFVCPPLLRPFSGASVSLTVSGLTTTAKWPEWLAIGLGGLLVVFVGVALLVRPRVGRRRALEYRRDLLLHALAEHDARRPEAEAAAAQHAQKRRELIEALDHIYRQLDVLGGAEASSTAR